MENNQNRLNNPGKLRRNPYDQSLGGVCSGIASFYNLDPVLIRVIFVIAMVLYGGGFLLYLILWMIIPEAKGEEAAYMFQQHSGKTRRLFRDADSRVIGGVAAGLSRYYGIDRAWIRLAFALSIILLGTGFWIYILLWIIVPKAVTEEEKLHMLRSDFTQPPVPHQEPIIYHGKTLFSKLVRGVLLLIGSLLAFVLFCAIVGVSIGLVVIFLNLGESQFINEWIDFTVKDSDVLFCARAGVILCLLTPLIGLLLLTLQLLLGIKMIQRHAIMGLAIIFLGGSILLIYSGLKFRGTVNESILVQERISMNPCDTLYLLGGEIPYINESEDDGNNTEMVFRDKGVVHGKDQFYLEVDDIHIGNGNTDSIILVITRKSNGADPDDAKKKMNMIQFHPEIDGNRILIPTWFVLEKNSQFSWQGVDINLLVPERTVLNLDMNIKEILDDQNLDQADGNWYQFRKGKLFCLDCDQEQPHRRRRN